MFINSDIFDAALKWLIEHTTKLYICDIEPKTYNEAIDHALAEIAVNAGDFMEPLDYYGDGDGDEVLSRIVIVTTVTGIGSKDGSPSHIALTSTDGLLLTTPCESESEVIADLPLTVRDWCVIAEYVEGDCEIPEGYLEDDTS